MPTEGIGRIQLHFRSMGQDWLPVVSRGVGHRGFDETKVGGRIIGGDEEGLLVMRDTVLDPCLASLDQAEWQGGLVGGTEPNLRTRVAADIEQEVVATPASADLHVERCVWFHVDQDVLGLQGSDGVTVQSTRSTSLVQSTVEESLTVIGPRRMVRSTGDAFLQEGPAYQVFDE